MSDSNAEVQKSPELLALEQKDAEDVRRGIEWGIRALNNQAESSYMPWKSGRTIEQILIHAGWKKVDNQWNIRRRAYDPRTKYNRDTNTLTYHSPDEKIKVWIVYVTNSNPAVCKCSIGPVKKKKKKK